MFGEFIFFIADYIAISKRYRWFDILLPLIITIIIAVFVPSSIFKLDNSFLGNVLTLVGVLAGFNITALTVLITADNKNLDELKSKKTSSVLNRETISLYKALYVFISYSVFLAFAILFIEIIGYIIPVKQTFGIFIYGILSCLNVTAIMHLILLNIRNITFIYFSFFNQKDSERKKTS
ncbi:hypothetical protein SAMN04487907_101237 [Zunongwangia mangrovi]|uniref:Uncharacterized protein n=1 Tax=Zunongwangia mangrovi TaxID=1334022 RepID=A0A1I1DBM5_9FLAO|nr:hypothetical protein [Zunongwangia mangrovi]SFB71762.1 hypothetical protein SAMN04487907_101237 [Zunongwangia mangrovi]